MEKNAPCNDDDELSFITLKAATLNAVQWLMEAHDEKQNENCGKDGQANESNEQKPESHRRYVDCRLRELAAFEERARGRFFDQRPRNLAQRGEAPAKLKKI
jgi:hypothetical protein